MNRFLLIPFFLWSTISNAQWSHFNPGTTDYITDLSFVSDQVGYAASGLWLWQTTDGGTNWQMQFNDSPVYSIKFLNQDTGLAINEFKLLRTTNGGVHWDTVLTDSSLLWFSDPFYVNDSVIIMAQATYFTTDTVVVYKSVDYGATWNLLTKIRDPHFGNAVDQLVFTDPLTGYLLCTGAMLKTIDGGLTWNFVKEIVYSSHFFNADTGVAINTVYLYKTFDGGLTWDSIPHFSSSVPYEVHFITPLVGFICGGNGFNSGYIKKTTDGGMTWTLDHTDVQTFDRFSYSGLTSYSSGTGGSVIKNNFYVGDPNISGHSFEISPNPTEGKFKIELPIAGLNVEILIYNSMGKLISDKMESDKHEIQIDLTNYPAGIYFVHTLSVNRVFTGKVIKE